MSAKLTTQQIGRCGELLVQQKLLLKGIESAPMTTDFGIDLVAYLPMRQNAITIQVKTCLKAKGKWKPELSWWVPEPLESQYYAFADLEKNRAWLLKRKELVRFAQQHPQNPPRYHLCMRVDPTAKGRKDRKRIHDYEFEKYLLENKIPKI